MSDARLPCLCGETKHLYVSYQHVPEHLGYVECLTCFRRGPAHVIAPGRTNEDEERDHATARQAFRDWDAFIRGRADADRHARIMANLEIDERPLTERRAPVQASIYERRPDGSYGTGCAKRPRGSKGSVKGTISWQEHEQAWRAYAKSCGASQSAERIAERAGFDWWELCDFLGHEPRSWEPTR